MSGKSEKSFWITNISKRDVSLADLAISVRAFTSVNLLDSRHYHLTEQQIKASAESGSIFKKRDKIVVRVNAPAKNQPAFVLKEVTSFPNRARSGIPVIAPKYEELELSDDVYAEEMAELAEEDRKPLIPKD